MPPAKDNFKNMPFLGLRNYVVLRNERQLFAPVSFDLHPGQSLQLKAVNGGGKTSLLRSLYGLAIEHQGEIILNGSEATNTMLQSQCVYMNDRAGVYAHLSTAENLRYMLMLHAVELSSQQCNKTLERVGLMSQQHLLAHKLSKGQKKRLHLARLHLLGKPLWLLDEPFEGLDTEGMELLREIITYHIAAGAAVVFSSHMDAKSTYRSHMQLELLGLQA